jgi:hypothetical protein
MASLTGNLIAGSYLGLIKTVDNSPITSVTKSITDGAGNATPLFLSSTLFKVTGSQQITGSLKVTDGANVNEATITSANITVQTVDSLLGAYMDEHGLEFYSGSDFFDITVQGQNFGNYESGSLFSVSDATGNPATIMKFQNYGNWTDGTVTVVRPFQMQSGSRITGSVTVSGSITSTLGFTGSLQGTAVNAFALSSFGSSSFALTGSNNFTGNQTVVGNQTVTGSVRVSGSLILSTNSHFVFPTSQPASPLTGSAYYSANFLYIYNGEKFVSASFS